MYSVEDLANWCLSGRFEYFLGCFRPSKSNSWIEFGAEMDCVNRVTRAGSAGKTGT